MKKMLLLTVVGLSAFSLSALDIKKYAATDLEGMDKISNPKGNCIERRYADLQKDLTAISKGTDAKAVELAKAKQALVDKYCSCCSSTEGCTGKGLTIKPTFTYKARGKDAKTYTNILVMWEPASMYEKYCADEEQKSAMNGKQWFMECAECKG